VIRLLRVCGANLDGTNYDKRTALMIAAEQKHYMTLVYLLVEGAQPNQQVKKKKKKKTTLGWVVNGGRRHAEPQGELVPRGCWVEKTCLPVTYPTPVFFT
jgi:hypothetical protein